MDLKGYIERSRIVDLAKAPGNLDELLGLLQTDLDLSTIVQSHRELVEKLPRAFLRRLWDARWEWRLRQEAEDRLEETIATSGLDTPPEPALARALVPHKVDALGRALRICPRADFPDEEAWSAALVALLDVWSGSVNQTLRRGYLKIELDKDHAGAAEFQQFARRTEDLSELKNHRWLAIRRGQRAGALSLNFEPPLSSIFSHLDGVKRLLGPAGERDSDALLEEMVLSVLNGYLIRILDERADEEAIKAAAQQYVDLLQSAPRAAGRVGAVAIRADGSRVGVIVVSEADLPELQEIVTTDDDDWSGKVVGILSAAGVEQVVIPMSSPASEIHSELRTAVGKELDVSAVRVAALAEARQMLTEPPLSLPAEIASALVLARRALQPSDEWERVDPLAIGLADYQDDLDQRRLREAMEEALGLFQLDRASGAFVPPAPKTTSRGGGANVRLNPLVGKLADLRPGMTVNGVITNITRFGAFVNIGLSEEGMIHISELSTEYVQSPSDVVAIGDKVEARVLEVEPHKRRIALSLKPPPAPRERGRNVPLDTRGGRGGGRGGGGRTMGRAAALEQLENLFKK